MLAVANFSTIKQSNESTWFPLSYPCGFFSFLFGEAQVGFPVTPQALVEVPHDVGKIVSVE